MYILPNPQRIEITQEHFTLTYHGRIVIDSASQANAFTNGCSIYSYAKLLSKEMEGSIGFSPAIIKGKPETGDIFLEEAPELKEEEYTLTIQADGVRIQGGSAAGVLYGIQTLRQIIAQEGASLPCLIIRDFPDTLNRGYYLDVTRGRIPTLEYLKEFADKLSYYKINQLQLYIEHSFLFREFSEVWRDDTPLTAQEILELDAYCRELHIELVPSISTFGHLYKLLNTKTYGYLCELPDWEGQPFSLNDRMHHHTIDVSNKDSLAVIKKMIDEYLPLFSSKQFNICADETFDLGKGRSRKLADELGVDEIYICYVKELCDYIIEKGKRPMFWGDIICGFPEAINRLPAETICLNWGYSSDQSEESARALNQVGATQYLCPGVAGWNQFINLITASYENISRMCSYAHKYHALGVLNTDWGDFGHINHPEFSVSGMIYSAAFSWNHNIPGNEEINRQISVLEFSDDTQSLVEQVAALAENSVFAWYHAVCFMELDVKGAGDEEKKEYLTAQNFNQVKDANEAISLGIEQLYRLLSHLEYGKRSKVKPYIIAAEGMALFNTIGATICNKQYESTYASASDPKELAKQLEHWFYHYKELWRSVSRESELYRIQNVILWYADRLREI